MHKISAATRKRLNTTKSKKSARARKLHDINTGAVKAARPRFDDQINMGTKQRFKRGFEKGAVMGVSGVVGWNIGRYGVPALKLAGRGLAAVASNPARLPGPYLATMVAIDMATPGFAKRVDRRMQNARGEDHARKMRAKTGRGGVIQRLLDFDIGEYMRGEYNDPSKAHKKMKVRSVQNELSTGKKNSAKSEKRKSPTKTAVRKKRAGRTFKRTRVVNGKRINETVRNHRYGK